MKKQKKRGTPRKSSKLQSKQNKIQLESLSKQSSRDYYQQSTDNLNQHQLDAAQQIENIFDQQIIPLLASTLLHGVELSSTVPADNIHTDMDITYHLELSTQYLFDGEIESSRKKVSAFKKGVH